MRIIKREESSNVWRYFVQKKNLVGVWIDVRSFEVSYKAQLFIDNKL
jgi:hypothetical protein